jgi:hypothetical protein
VEDGGSLRKYNTIEDVIFQSILYTSIELSQWKKKRIKKTLEYIGSGNNFLNRTPVAQQIREMIDKWDCIELESFCTAK